MAIGRIRGFGVGMVLAELDGGVVLVDGTGGHHAEYRIESNDGDRIDALLAGFLAAGASGPDALAEAVAQATALADGSRVTAADREAVSIKWIDALELAWQ
jgi:1-phosphofructokinase